MITSPDADILEDEIVTTAGSYSATAQLNGGAWIMQMVAFRAAGSGGGTPPAITSAISTTFAAGAAGSFTVTTTGSPTPSLSESGALPTGVTFTNNGNGTATLNGAPGSGTAGSYSLTFTASNGVGTPATQSFSLTVNQTATITSANSTTFTVGAAGNFTVTATGTPTPSPSESGTLPTGVTFTNDGNGTATLSGTPGATTAGTYSITFTASNGVGTPASQPFTLTVVTSGGGGHAITLVQHASLDSSGISATLAFNSNNSAGNWIGVAIRAGALNEVFTVTDSNGNPYHKAIQFNETGNGNTMGIFYAENIAAGANTITVSDTTSATLRFAILEYSGVATSNSLDVTATAQGDSASPNSGNATTTANGDLLLGAIMTSDAATFTAGSGYKIEESVPAEPNTKLVAEDQVQAIAETVSASATLGGPDFWAAGVAAFKAGSSGGGEGTAPKAVAPTFSPAGGSYTSAQSVTLSDTISGASIYYTTNGSTPTTSSTLYTGPISVTQTTTINAIAVASGFANSPVATASYTINLPQAAAPTFSPAGGSYTSAQSVTLSDTISGGSIYYTTNGSTPTTSSTLYTGPISVTQTTTINAIAVASGLANSPVRTASYTINLPQAAAPTFSPAGGSYTSAQSVTLSDGTSGAAIYYTTNGSTPTTASTLYTGPISVTQTTTINAIAVASGFANSPVGTATYTINLSQAAASSFTHVQGNSGASGAVGSTTVSVTLLNSVTAGDFIACGLSGFEPTNTALVSVVDQSGNVYSTSPHSPTAYLSGAGMGWLLYNLTPPAGNTTITGTLGAAAVYPGQYILHCDEFRVTGGTPAFDLDAVNSDAGPGTTMNLPSITPSSSGSLLYAVGNPRWNITACGASWVCGGSGIQSSTGYGLGGTATEYITSASGATAINFTQNQSGTWSALVMSFKITPTP